MCNFQLWFQSAEDVYVLQCTECNTFQVRLRNAAFMFEPLSYSTFRDRINKTWRDVDSGNKRGPIVIPTFNSGIDLLLNTAQLAELYQLMDDADTEMKAAQMNRLFYEY